MGAAEMVALGAAMHERDSLSDALDTWRQWMRRDDSHLGYPSRAAGIRYSAGRDFDQMTDDLDERIARAVDACVDSLPLMERTAVYAAVIGPMVWRLREPMPVVYERARGMLRVALKRKGIE